MIEKYYVDDNNFKYKILNRGAYPDGYLSKEKPIPLGTLRYINKNICYLSSIIKYKRQYELRWETVKDD